MHCGKKAYPCPTYECVTLEAESRAGGTPSLPATVARPRNENFASGGAGRISRVRDQIWVRTWRGGRVLEGFAVLTLLVAMGCGGSEAQTSLRTGAEKSHGLEKPSRTQSLGVGKKTQWSLARVARHAVDIGAFVPYCGGENQEPFIERVARHRSGSRVVLTMFVRFPHVKGACVGEGISVAKWIPVRGNARRLTFFDGAVSPPAKRSN